MIQFDIYDEQPPPEKKNNKKAKIKIDTKFLKYM